MILSKRALVQRWAALASSRSWAIAAAGLLIAAIAVLDERTSPSVGLLYLFPIILIGTRLGRPQVVFTAAVCTWLTALFNRNAFETASLAQHALVFIALAGTGFVAYELTRSRRREVEHREAVEREAAARREAEEQLIFLINTSPAAILTMANTGEIVAANGAAHRMLGVIDGELPGRPISRYVPALGRVVARAAVVQTFQTEMRCRGERENGTAFPADVFFSTYTTAQGPRLAAMVIDTSADLVDREESGLEQLMTSSRVLVSAMTHEIRNLCGAVAVVHENLARSGKLSGNQDFDALGTLVDALTRMASVQLRNSHQQTRIAETPLFDVLDDLRVVLDPICEDVGIPIEWCVEAAEEAPVVSVDQHHLLQALLNLTKNSQRAMQNVPMKRLLVTVVEHDDVVSIRVTDSGPGPAVIEHLFQPFQKGAACTGLGLYVSRALVRSFRGDLRYEPGPACTFIVDVPKANRQRARAPVMSARNAVNNDSHSIAAR